MTQIAADDVMTPNRRRLMLGLLAIILLALPTAIAWNIPLAPSANSPVVSTALPKKQPAAVPPPVVEPVKLIPIDPEKARTLNFAVPFSVLPNPAARPFVLEGTADNLARATDCLAAAAWYEAGDDALGQRAVVQVVLNRLRHPAFPKTVCGVVFQGAERATGCQFTFTCDGALGRRPSDAAWQRARVVARAALAGTVFGPVGNSTHYHTDWVRPYWSGSLDKVTAVGTHLFFRWKGWWGTPAAFRNTDDGTEPVVPLIARLSPVHAVTPSPDAAAPPGLAGTLTGKPYPAEIRPVSTGQHFGTAEVVAVDPVGASFILALDRTTAPDSFQVQALNLCGGRPYCRVMGWTDTARTPGGFPIYPGLLDAMAYSYIRDRGSNMERSLWNCDQYPRPSASQCMRERNPARLAMEGGAG